MVLDSGGYNQTVRVSCLFCPLTLQIATRIITSGHDGEIFDPPLGPYICDPWLASDTHRKSFGALFRGSWYTVALKEPGSGEGFRFVGSHPSGGSPYAYGMRRLPDIGIGLGRSFWVCESCD